MRNNVFKCLPSFSTNYPLIQLSFHVCNDGVTKLFDKFTYACFVQLRFLAYVRLNEYFMNYQTHLNLTSLSFFLLAVVRIFQVCVTSSIPFDRGKPCMSQSSPMDKRLDLRTSRLKEGGMIRARPANFIEQVCQAEHWHVGKLIPARFQLHELRLAQIQLIQARSNLPELNRAHS